MFNHIKRFYGCYWSKESCDIILKKGADPYWTVYQEPKRKIDVYVEIVLKQCYFYQSKAESLKKLPDVINLMKT